MDFPCGVPMTTLTLLTPLTLLNGLYSQILSATEGWGGVWGVSRFQILYGSRGAGNSFIYYKEVGGFGPPNPPFLADIIFEQPQRHSFSQYHIRLENCKI